MARIRNNYVFSEDKSKQSLYPWGEWTDGNVWEARQGKDYIVKTKSFQDSLRYRAKTYQMTLKMDVSTFRGAEVVIFQFVKTRSTAPSAAKTRTIATSPSRKKKPAGRRNAPTRVGITKEEKAVNLDRDERATDLPASVAELHGQNISTPLRRPTTNDFQKFRGRRW